MSRNLNNEYLPISDYSDFDVPIKNRELFISARLSEHSYILLRFSEKSSDFAYLFCFPGGTQQKLQHIEKWGVCSPFFRIYILYYSLFFLFKFTLCSSYSCAVHYVSFCFNVLADLLYPALSILLFSYAFLGLRQCALFLCQGVS